MEKTTTLNQTSVAPFNEQQYVMWMHLTQLAGIVGIPSFIGPLVMWLIKKDISPRINSEGKEILNFQITMCILALVSVIGIIILIGFIGIMVLVVASIVFPIIAAVKTNEGLTYKYPLIIRFIK